jgi:hypothetical protein
MIWFYVIGDSGSDKMLWHDVHSCQTVCGVDVCGDHVMHGPLIRALSSNVRSFDMTSDPVHCPRIQCTGYKKRGNIASHGP